MSLTFPTCVSYVTQFRVSKRLLTMTTFKIYRDSQLSKHVTLIVRLIFYKEKSFKSYTNFSPSHVLHVLSNDARICQIRTQEKCFFVLMPVNF